MVMKFDANNAIGVTEDFVNKYHELLEKDKIPAREFVAILVEGLDLPSPGSLMAVKEMMRMEKRVDKGMDGQAFKKALNCFYKSYNGGERRPLWHAMRVDVRDAAKFMLDNGADPNLSSAKEADVSFVDVAVRNSGTRFKDSTKQLELLKEYGCNFNELRVDKVLPFLQEEERFESLNYLARNGMELSCRRLWQSLAFTEVPMDIDVKAMTVGAVKLSSGIKTLRTGFNVVREKLFQASRICYSR